jgi:hypothetical protein
VVVVSVVHHGRVRVFAPDHVAVQVLERRAELLPIIRPQYLILKPSLLGGFQSCEDWIDLAEEYNIGWWATSALESTVGLNAIAQWIFTKQNKMVQGLGTGGLYTNNIKSPLYIRNGELGYTPGSGWGEMTA